MRYIILAVILFHGITSVIADNGVYHNMKIEGNVHVLEQHLQQDERLLDADKNIGFIKRINAEPVNEQDLMTYPDISTPKLTLSRSLVFQIEQPSTYIDIEDSQGRIIGVNKRFNFISTLNDNKYFSFTVWEYSGIEGYYAARNDFLYGTRGTTMTSIPFTRWPDNLGTVSVVMGQNANTPFRKVIWLYHNLYFDSILNELSEEEQLHVLNWVQQQAMPINKSEKR